MRRRERDAQACFTFGHRRWANRRHQDAARAQGFAHRHHRSIAADDQRLDRRFGWQQAPTRGVQALLEIGCEFAQMLAAPGISAHQMQAGDQGAGQQGRKGRGVNVSARALHHGLDQRLAPGKESAEHPGRLAQRRHVNNARGRDAKIFQHAAPVLPQHAEAMRIVEHQARIVTLAQRQ